MLRSLALSLPFMILLAGCQAPLPHAAAVKAPAACTAGDPMLQTTVWFGLSKPQGGTIGEAEWQHFLSSDVTPRFPEGLSVYEANGQWQEKNGTIAHERSKALMLIHGAGDNEKIEALRALYKQRFSQESVMRIDAPVCVSF